MKITLITLITLITPTPRNPLVRLARSRHAGSHRVAGGAMRQHANRVMQRELDRMKHSP